MRVIQKSVIGCFLLAVIGFFTGCGTLVSIDSVEPLGVYSGVRTSVDFTKESLGAIQDGISPGGEYGNLYRLLGLAGLVSLPLAVIDIPFSFVADTLLLPYTGAKSLRAKKKKRLLHPEDVRDLPEFSSQGFSPSMEEAR